MDEMHNILGNFAKHYTDYIPEIPVLDHVPSPIEFYSDYVIPNKPFKISCRENHLPAIEIWKQTFYLEKTLYSAWPITFVTPQYRVNPLMPDMYIEPEVRKMHCYDILYYYYKKPRKEYHYVKQPNNLDQFPEIANDIRPDVPWATEALGSGPIAANLSMGDRHSFTSLHKDEYDNFFYPLRGSRQFKLMPPIARVCLPYKKFKKFQWVRNYAVDEWDLKDLNEEIEMIPLEIEPDTLEKNGFYRNIKSYMVDVQPGEALYIPSLWFHEYHQSDDCFTLNYWYDLKWDLRFPLFRFLTKLFKVKNPSKYKEVSVDTQSELEISLLEDVCDEMLKTKKSC